MLELLNPFASHLIAFAIGMFFGFFIRGLYSDKNVNHNLLDSFIRYAVVILWVGAMTKAIFFNGTYPDVIFHLIFGAVYGATNKSGGEMVLKIIQSYTKKNK